MSLRLVQFIDEDGKRRVGVPSADGKTLQVLRNVGSVRELALKAMKEGRKLKAMAEAALTKRTHDYDAATAECRILPPIDHPDPAHCLVTGTGLTHLGSAESRDAMHERVAASGEESLTDSMKMFKWGLDGGKPPKGEAGVPPEWFYKGDGAIIAAPEAPLAMPAFAEDGGDESELAGIYVIGGDGKPHRIGFALGNEFSDHVVEKKNYLYLAHSKLRPCSIGPELLTGPLPPDVRGTSRIVRRGQVIWEKPFLSGEANMCHNIANLEHHHFKYPQHRKPGDVHVHFFGAATLSFTDGIKCEPGDVFELEVEALGRPLRNRLAVEKVGRITVRAL
jgi:hypothetical protein